jgi:hypothetical protein
LSEETKKGKPWKELLAGACSVWWRDLVPARARAKGVRSD